jgi:hypothetical protein
LPFVDMFYLLWLMFCAKSNFYGPRENFDGLTPTFALGEFRSREFALDTTRITVLDCIHLIDMKFCRSVMHNQV